MFIYLPCLCVCVCTVHVWGVRYSVPLPKSPPLQQDEHGDREEVFAEQEGETERPLGEHQELWVMSGRTLHRPWNTCTHMHFTHTCAHTQARTRTHAECCVPGTIKSDGFDLTTLSEERLQLFIVEECKWRKITHLREREKSSSSSSSSPLWVNKRVLSTSTVVLGSFPERSLEASSSSTVPRRK